VLGIMHKVVFLADTQDLELLNSACPADMPYYASNLNTSCDHVKISLKWAKFHTDV